MDISRRRFLSASITSFLGAGAVSEFLTPALADNSPEEPETVPKIIGHRGFSDEYPDNSMAGFRAAHRAGADGVEVDVRETKDGRLVASHDWFAADTPKGAGLIDSVTWENLQDLNSNIPLFEDVLGFVETTELDLYIELKVNNTNKVKEMVENYNISGEIVFLSFYPDWMEPVKDEYKTGLIGSVPSEWLLSRAKDNGHDMALPHFTSTSSMKRFFESASNKEIESGYWAISGDKSDIMLGLNSNPNIVITNNPEEANNILKSN